MTSNAAIDKAASNGTANSTETKPARPEHGIAVLREKEARALISLACDGISQTSQAGNEIHRLVYAGETVPGAQFQQQLEEALTCLQTADHYLRMLGDILDERAADSPAPWPTDLAS